MRNTTKILSILGGTIIAATAIIYLGKKYKKQVKIQEDLKEEEIEEQKEVGLSEDLAAQCNDIVAEEGDLPKAMFSAVTYGTGWDKDMFNVDAILSNNRLHLLHVVQSEDDQLDFLFEIPLSACRQKNNSYSPRVGDYINSIRAAGEHMEREIIRDTRSPWGALIGYFAIQYVDGEGITQQSLIRIPSECYERYRSTNKETGKTRDGLTDFLGFIHEGKKTPSEIAAESATQILEMCNRTFPNQDISSWKNCVIIRAILTYKLSFSISRPIGRSMSPGIKTETGLKCLKYLTEEFIIHSSRDSREIKASGVTYQDVVFNVFNENLGTTDLLFAYYYDTKSQKIINVFCEYETKTPESEE